MMEEYLQSLKGQFNNRLKIHQKRPGIFQLFAPFYHEDGDMYEIYLEKLNGKIRVSDYGMAVMRLSYEYEIDTAKKQEVFERILSENQVQHDDGKLMVDADPDMLYSAVMQIAQVIGKITNMGHFKREVIRSMFYEQLNEFVMEGLSRFNPEENFLPIEGRDEYRVDYRIPLNGKPAFVFGVKGEDKAKITTICCLEFQNTGIPFRGVAVHEDFNGLNNLDRKRLTSAIDKQFTDLDDFVSRGINYLEREMHITSPPPTEH